MILLRKNFDGISENPWMLSKMSSRKKSVHRLNELIQRYDFVDIDWAAKIIDWDTVPVAEV